MARPRLCARTRDFGLVGEGPEHGRVGETYEQREAGARGGLEPVAGRRDVPLRRPTWGDAAVVAASAARRGDLRAGPLHLARKGRRKRGLVGDRLRACPRVVGTLGSDDVARRVLGEVFAGLGRARDRHLRADLPTGARPRFPGERRTTVEKRRDEDARLRILYPRDGLHVGAVPDAIRLRRPGRSGGARGVRRTGCEERGSGERNQDRDGFHRGRP